ncbi:Chondroitin Sulfate Synthase 3 [Manis pentadactyla]|nr:Chondroitin Sulfate Synthase 3 [Manis pentadactyla]
MFEEPHKETEGWDFTLILSVTCVLFGSRGVCRPIDVRYPPPAEEGAVAPRIPSAGAGNESTAGGAACAAAGAEALRREVFPSEIQLSPRAPARRLCRSWRCVGTGGILGRRGANGIVPATAGARDASFPDGPVARGRVQATPPKGVCRPIDVRYPPPAEEGAVAPRIPSAGAGNESTAGGAACAAAGAEALRREVFPSEIQLSPRAPARRLCRSWRCVGTGGILGRRGANGIVPATAGARDASFPDGPVARGRVQATPPKGGKTVSQFYSTYQGLVSSLSKFL